MYLNFSLYAFFVKMLPPVLRSDGIKAFLWTLLSPMDNLVSRFKGVVNDADRRLSHNAFTIYLEKYLNDLLGVDDAIYIEDVIDDFSIYLTKKAENEDYNSMTKRTEELTTLVIPAFRPGELVGRFAVYIPECLDTPENRALISRWVNYYKFAGTKFTIETYEQTSDI